MPTSVQSIDIHLNGEHYSLDAPATIASLVQIRKPIPPFAVELNKNLVRRNQFDATTLSAGDRVEIVTLVGGG